MSEALCEITTEWFNNQPPPEDDDVAVSLTMLAEGLPRDIADAKAMDAAAALASDIEQMIAWVMEDGRPSAIAADMFLLRARARADEAIQHMQVAGPALDRDYRV